MVRLSTCQGTFKLWRPLARIPSSPDRMNAGTVPRQINAAGLSSACAPSLPSSLPFFLSTTTSPHSGAYTSLITGICVAHC